MPTVISAGHKKALVGVDKGRVAYLPQSSQIKPSTGACLHGAPAPLIHLPVAVCPDLHQALQEQRGLLITAALAAAVRGLADQRHLTPAQLLHHWQPEAC
jgi:hypothetical protein